MQVMLVHVAELMVLLPSSCRESGRQDVPLADRRLGDQARIDTCRLEGFGKRRTKGSKHLSRHRASLPPLPRDAARGEQRTATTVTPEQSRPHDSPGIAGQIGPAVLINVIFFLPVTTREERCGPRLTERLRRKQDSVRAAASRAIEQRFTGRLLLRAP